MPLKNCGYTYINTNNVNTVFVKLYWLNKENFPVEVKSSSNIRTKRRRNLSLRTLYLWSFTRKDFLAYQLSVEMYCLVQSSSILSYPMWIKGAKVNVAWSPQMFRCYLGIKQRRKLCCLLTLQCAFTVTMMCSQLAKFFSGKSRPRKPWSHLTG